MRLDDSIDLRLPVRRVVRPRPAALLLVGLLAFLDFASDAATTVPASTNLVVAAVHSATNTLASPVAPSPVPLPDVVAPITRVFGALVVVLAVFFGVAWFVRNGRGFPARQGRSPVRLRILETRGLGGRHALHVIGRDDQRWLVASSPSGITLLDRLPAATPEEVEAQPPAPSNFAEALRRILPSS